MGRRDSNPRIPVPKTGALPLGHAPSLISHIAYVDGIIAQIFCLVKGFEKKDKNFCFFELPSSGYTKRINKQLGDYSLG